ncbi:MAG: type II toxin-antitoxin system VapC family toxin [Thermoproteus sp. AZ2]|jgi:predicted nucleic acid-binding protein|uniref:Type II toxin-antitoxin system VapC family toxin n=1 Tax=Thermoproteus sp. AZ2 TaxID=1609232 RepID=A0ACC6V121_9CREN
MRLVVDTSALAALYIPEQLSGFIRRTIEESRELHFLDLAYYEFANVLRKRVGRGELGPAKAEEILREGLELLSISVVHRAEEVVAEAYNIALSHNITVYDAALIAVAEKIGGKVLTADLALLRAVRGTPLSDLFQWPPISI